MADTFMPDTFALAVMVEHLPDHVVLITLNRPQSRNTINGDVTQGLHAAIDLTETDDEVWAVILKGTGDEAFCAGGDLKAIASGQREGLRTERGGFAGFMHAERRKPWIAAVNGPALAGGRWHRLRAGLRPGGGRARCALWPARG